MLYQIQVEVHNTPGGKAIDCFDTFERAGIWDSTKNPTFNLAMDHVLNKHL
jgi:hypothetical protein